MVSANVPLLISALEPAPPVIASMVATLLEMVKFALSVGAAAPVAVEVVCVNLPVAPKSSVPPWVKSIVPLLVTVPVAVVLPLTFKVALALLVIVCKVLFATFNVVVP